MPFINCIREDGSAVMNLELTRDVAANPALGRTELIVRHRRRLVVMAHRMFMHALSPVLRFTEALSLSLSSRSSCSYSFCLWLLFLPPRRFPYFGSSHRVFIFNVLLFCASSIYTVPTYLSVTSFCIESLHFSFSPPDTLSLYFV